MREDRRRHAPAVARNREAIRQVLRRYMPQRGRVLEIASGTGEHVAFLAAASDPGLIFQPTDLDAAARESIDAWTKALGLTNVLPALALDAASERWPFDTVDLVVCINMVHISPWPATVGLMRGAARSLAAGGILYLYGPYRREGRHTAPSNEAFDRDLRSRNPDWGVRDLEAVAQVAAEAGFEPPIIEEMPANNLSAIFRRKPAA